MKEEYDKIDVKYNEDGTAFVIHKDDGKIYHLVNNKTFNFKQKCFIGREPKRGKVNVPALLVAILMASGILTYYKSRELKSILDAQKKEREITKNSLDYYIENKDIIIVKMFFDEALSDLDLVKENNLEAENVYKAMYSELCLAEKENYALHIKEGAKMASDAGIYFGIDQYEKYLNAKVVNGEVYFPLASVFPSSSQEEIVGEIVITYLHEDTTPYVSASSLQEYKQNKESLHK